MSCAAVMLAATLLSGCTRSSFLGRQFDDLTAHYNTYYNASRTFKEQQKRAENQNPKIDLDRYLLVYDVPVVSGRSAELEKVIEKSADLLRKHPESKWVDDALMLIGKSYFFQANYVGAEQKFTEIIALDGPLFDEAAFWLARTLVAGQSVQAAEDVIRTALSSERLQKKWKPHFNLVLGDLRVDSRDWEGSIQALETAIPDIHENDIAARAQFLLGQLYETIEDYPASISAFRDVQRYKPLYELSFAAMYSQFRVEGLYGDSETALAGLQRMGRDNKHYQNIDRIDYNSARVYAASGDAIAARRLFMRTLYPAPGQRASSIRGEVHYRLAELYRDVIGDFYRSAAHFDTASSVLRTTTLQNVPYTPDAITNARAIADVFSTYRDVLDEVEEMDSLLYLGTLDDEAFDEAIQAVRQQLAVEAALAAEELRRRQTQSSFQTGERASAGAQRQVNVGAGQQRQRFGFLNHKDIQRVQEAFLNFRREWGDRPLIPGWRREEIVLSTRSTQQDQLDNVDGPVQDQATSGAILNFLPPVDISNVPRDSVSRAKMKSSRAAARYKLANVLFLSMSLPDSAAYWYRLVVEEDAGEPVALRAQYAMAEVHIAMGDDESGERLFAQIIRENPESVFADRARVSLGIEIVSESADSLDIALAQYGNAYGLWNAGDRGPALNAMIRTAADNPRAEIAAKGLLAAGAIFVEMARAESIDLFGIITLNDSLFTPAELELARKDIEPEPSSLVEDSVAGIDSTAQLSVAEPDSQKVRTPAEKEGLDSALALQKSQNRPDPIDDRRDVKSVAPEGEPSLDSTGVGAISPVPSGDLLIQDDELRRRGRPGNDGQAEGTEPVTDTTEAMLPLDSTGVVLPPDSTEFETDATAPAPTVSQPAVPPPPQKPDWISPEYFVNAVIPQPLTLHALFSSVEQNFQGTDYGDRASVLKRGLIAYRDESFAPPDTTAPVAAPGVDTTTVSLDR